MKAHARRKQEEERKKDVAPYHINDQTSLDHLSNDCRVAPRPGGHEVACDEDSLACLVLEAGGKTAMLLLEETTGHFDALAGCFLCARGRGRRACALGGQASGQPATRAARPAAAEAPPPPALRFLISTTGQLQPGGAQQPPVRQCVPFFLLPPAPWASSAAPAPHGRLLACAARAAAAATAAPRRRPRPCAPPPASARRAACRPA